MKREQRTKRHFYLLQLWPQGQITKTNGRFPPTIKREARKHWMRPWVPLYKSKEVDEMVVWRKVGDTDERQTNTAQCFCETSRWSQWQQLTKKNTAYALIKRTFSHLCIVAPRLLCSLFPIQHSLQRNPIAKIWNLHQIGNPSQWAARPSLFLSNFICWQYTSKSISTSQIWSCTDAWTLDVYYATATFLLSFLPIMSPIKSGTQIIVHLWYLWCGVDKGGSRSTFL